MPYASIIALLQTALMLLTLAQGSTVLPQSVRDNAVQVAHQAIDAANAALANNGTTPPVTSDPNATIDASSLVSGSQFYTLSGTATNTDTVDVWIGSGEDGRVAVVNGRWSDQIKANAGQTITIYAYSAATGPVLATGTLSSLSTPWTTSVSLDVSAMSIATTRTNIGVPYVTGSASGISQFIINIYGVTSNTVGAGGWVIVRNGRWEWPASGTSVPLPVGTYKVTLSTDQTSAAQILATGTLTVTAPAIATNPNNLPFCPANAMSVRGQNPQTFACFCQPGFSVQSVWGGPSYYSDNSDICTAGALDGQMNATSGGEVDYRIGAGQTSYPAWTANGISSQAYNGSWPGSFQIVGPKG